MRVMPSITASLTEGAIVRMSRATTRRLAPRYCTSAMPMRRAVFSSIWSG
jgi:hypothetical protein